jgi:hypothetical protein
VVESGALLKRCTPKGYPGFESLPHRCFFLGKFLDKESTRKCGHAVVNRARFDHPPATGSRMANEDHLPNLRLKKKRLNAILRTVVFLSWSCLFSSAGQVDQQSLSLSPSPTQRGAPQQPHYLTGNEDVWSTFPLKPALGSPTDQADLLITLSLQNSRTEDQKKEALGDQKYSIRLITDVIATDFKTKYPNTFKVLAKCRYRRLFHYSKAQEDKRQVATICPASGPRYAALYRG